MGTLNGEHIIEKLESNGLNHSTSLVEEEEEHATISDIQDSVKILLQGLGEDSNREGLIKTPLRVAKALREGTRGSADNMVIATSPPQTSRVEHTTISYGGGTYADRHIQATQVRTWWRKLLFDVLMRLTRNLTIDYQGAELCVAYLEGGRQRKILSLDIAF